MVGGRRMRLSVIRDLVNTEKTESSMCPQKSRLSETKLRLWYASVSRARDGGSRWRGENVNVNAD